PTPSALRYLGRGQRGRPTSTRSQHVVPETVKVWLGVQMVAQFQLQLFGSPQLVRGRSLVRFRTKKHLAVLLYLHFEGRARAISRDRLVELLWPDVPADKGRHSLSQALLAIRSRLGTDAVTGREQDVTLLAELQSDHYVLLQGPVENVSVDVTF